MSKQIYKVISEGNYIYKIFKTGNYVECYLGKKKIYETKIKDFYFLEKPEVSNVSVGQVSDKDVNFIVDISEYDGCIMYGDNFLVKTENEYVFFGEKIISFPLDNFRSFTRIDFVYYLVSNEYYYDICDGKRYKSGKNVNIIRRGKSIYFDFSEIFVNEENFDYTVIYE